ncbi:MAG: ATP-dependent Clp protease ATP-binding subunit [Candidatus Pacebacteria bacterium]|nr:ATP-dependent Clp protease ATP-binding subunit [Candidatus Paceibacterota bacterium]
MASNFNLNFKDETSENRGDIFMGQKLFWKSPLSRSVIYLKRAKKKTDKIILIVCYLLAVSGWLALFLWFYRQANSEQAQYIFDVLQFWNYKSGLILWFFISLFFDFFIIYKRSERIKAKEKIKYSQNLDDQESPNALAGIKSRGNKDLASYFSDPALDIVENAYLLAKKLKQSQVSPRHIFWVLLSDKTVKVLFVRLNLDAHKLVDKLKKYLIASDRENLGVRGKLSPTTEKICLNAYISAFTFRQEAVEPWNLLVPCLEEDKIIEEILYDLSIDKDMLVNMVEWHRIDKQFELNRKSLQKLSQLKPGSAMNKSYTAVATPTLNQFSRDLTLKAKYNQFEICVGREKEFTAIFQAWQSGQAGVLLVGEPGTGKKTMVEGLAQLMVKEEVPKFLQDKRLLELDVARLISGSSPSEAQEKLLTCLYEINRAGNIVLFVDNLENLGGISAGGEQSLDLSEVLADALDKKALFFIASASSSNYSRYIESSALGHLLTTVGVAEPTVNQSIRMVESKVSALESRYNIYFSYRAIAKAVKMTDKYIQNKFLPAKAIDVIKASAGKAYQRASQGDGDNLCTEQDVASVISEITGVPVSQIGEDESHKLLHLEEFIHERMIDQEEAVQAVSASLRRSRAELRESSRPMANFLFLGPTGVGKTELAKSVSDIYFGSEDYMIRLDMSEYQHPDSVKKMIGDSDGSLGYLTEAVRKKPFALVLLDEIEKAHPDILNLFLQIMDDGRLTDGQGRTVNFSNAIIIATSNAGALYIQESVRNKEDMAVIKQNLIDNHLNKVMRPELINRFDGIIVFEPLSEEDILAIAKLMLNKMNKRLGEKGLSLKCSDRGLQVLAKEGYDPEFGARPLRRLLQDKIENEIANLFLAKKLQRRDIVYINDEAKIEVIEGKEL